MGDYIGKDAQPDVALTFVVSFNEGVAGEWVVEDMAEFEEVVEPSSALDDGHSGFEVVQASDLVEMGFFLRTADVLTV